jgi:hypothetical protein
VTNVANSTINRLKANGTTLTLGIDGVDHGTTQTDSSHSGGAAGMFDKGGIFHDNWEGGDLASSGAGSWNGLSFTQWNGVAITAWNGTAIRCP